METSILNQYGEEYFPDIFQSQNPIVERLGDALMNFVNNDDESETIDIIDYILHDDEQQDTQVLYELEDNVANQRRPIDSQQHAIGDNNECITSPNLSNRECLSSTPPVEHLLQAHYAETFYQTLVDMAPVVGSPTEEQINAKKAPKIINDTDTCKMVNKEEIKKEISDSVNKSQEICKPAKRAMKQAVNIKKNQSTKRRNIRKKNYTFTKTNREEQEDCIDVETVSGEIPVLQAGDVTSLLEQFEATENMMLPLTSSIKKNHKSRLTLSIKKNNKPVKSTGRPRGRPRKRPRSQDVPKKPTLRCNNVQETDKHLLPQVVERLKARLTPEAPKKSTSRCNNVQETDKNLFPQVVIERLEMIKPEAPKKVTSRCNNVQETDKNLLPQVVIERLEMVNPVQNHKTVTLAIPDVIMEQPEINNYDTNQMQNDKLALCSNKPLKVVNSTMTSPKNYSNNSTQNGTKNSLFSVCHDHDYCRNNNSNTGNPSSNRLTKHTSKIQRNKNKNFIKTNKAIKYCRDNNLKKNSDLVSTKVRDTCKTSSTSSVLNKQTLTNSLLGYGQGNNCSKETPLRQTQANNLAFTKNVNVPNKSTNDTPMPEMKINSALAKSILKSRQDLLKKIQVQAYPTQQMVSVLKNPPNTSQSSILTNNPKESVVTTTNSTNEIIQNIIIQNAEDTQSQEQEKQPARKRLKLEEYRSRKQKYNGNVTTSSKRHVELVPIYNAFTSTELFTDDSGKQILCQQELFLHTRYKPDTDEENKPKPTTRDAETQTYRRNCESSTKPSIPNENRYTLERNDKSNFSRSPQSNSISKKIQSRNRDKTKEDKKKNNAAERTEKSTKSINMERSLKSKHRDKSKERRKNRKSRSKTRSKTRSLSRSHSIARSRENKNDSSKRRSRSPNDSKTSNSSSRGERSRSQSQCRGRSRKRRSHSRQQRRRRSSVSSSPSSSGSSRSKYQRSRSRSYRSRSRSSSRHYINHSRPSSHSNSERNRWSSRRNSRERSFERYKRQASYDHRDRDWRSRSPHYYHRRDDLYYEEKQRQVDERRVIYVGGIDRNTTKTDLYRRFNRFGSVVDISIHLRDNNDNYGFVTFLYRDDAYKALEHGNDDLDLPRYDLSFGGRRAFCQVKYEDLDGMANDSFNRRSSPGNTEGDFDCLLRQAKRRLV